MSQYDPRDPSTFSASYDPYDDQNYDPSMENDGFPASYNAPPAQDATGGDLSVKGDMAGWLEKSRKSIADIYDQAARDLQARYRGPSDKELLLSMGAAMLKPTYGGFGEALSNAVSVVPEFMKQKRAYQEELGQLMARGQYDKARALASLEGRALTAMKPAQRRTGFNPVTGTLVYMDTGETVGEGGGGGDLPVLSPAQVAAMARDPRNKGMKFKTNDGRTMEIR